MPKLDENPDIKEMIRRWRSRIIDLGMTQKQTADMSGITAECLSKIIRMKIKMPHKTTIEKVESLLASLESKREEENASC